MTVPELRPAYPYEPINAQAMRALSEQLVTAELRLVGEETVSCCSSIQLDPAVRAAGEEQPRRVVEVWVCSKRWAAGVLLLDEANEEVEQVLDLPRVEDAACDGLERLFREIPTHVTLAVQRLTT